ncbi:MAG: BACON domain-containing protein [Ktedonobacteraceae bacterium]
MDRCTFCGSELPREAQFCGYCGRVNISTVEMPTSMSGFPGGDILVDNAPTAITRPPHIDPASTAISKPSHPDLNSGEHDATSVRNTWPQEPITPPVPLASEEEDDDEEKRRRRALLLGIPLAGGLAEIQSLPGVPMVQGTPQVGSVPMVQGNPGGPFSAPSINPAATPTSSPFAPTLAVNTPPSHTIPPPHTSWPPSHGPTSGPGPSSSPGTTSSGTPGPGSSGSCALTSLIIVVITLVIFGTIGGLFFSLPPAISLNGSNVVTIGGNLHLQGSHFLPGSSITLTLDNSVRLFASTNVSGEAHSMGLLSMNAAGLLNAATTALRASAAGSFAITIPIGAGWKPGSHTLRATEGISSRSAVLSFTVEEPSAKLVVSPTTLDFGTLSVGSKTVLSLAVNNNGGKTLNWQANAGDTAWLKLSPTKGIIQPSASAQFIYVTADTTQLKIGSYSAMLTVNSNGGTQHVAITVHVNQPSTTQPCSLQSLSPSSVNFSASTGSNPADQTFTIAVTGNCANGVTITPTASTSTDSNWLAVSPASATLTGGSTTFTIHVTSSSLGSGSYSGAISLDAISGGSAISSSPQTLSVTLTVSEVPPVLTVDTASMSFNLSNGDSTSSKAFHISNTGGSALNWSLKLDAPRFVSLGSSSGKGLAAGTSVSDTVNVNPANQQAGKYSATVLIYAIDPLTGNSVKGSPATITVSITITAQPSMQLNPTSLTFTPDNCVYTASSTVSLSNTGGGTLSWNVASPVYTDSGDPGGWLSVSPSGQGSGTTTLTFSVDGYHSKVISGQTYTATVTVTPSVGNAQTVTVTFTMPYCIQ